MAWINIPGVTGKVYVPDDAGQMPKKHPCRTCYTCQWCDENRCRVCRGEGADSIGPASKQCCSREIKSCPSNPKLQAPNLK